MKDNNLPKLYLGNHLYFATGEGYHSYLLLVQADNELEAFNKFIDKVISKYPHSNQSSRPHFEACSTILEVNKVKLSDFSGPHLEIIKNVQELCKRGGMAGGDFELFYRYNLS